VMLWVVGEQLYTFFHRPISSLVISKPVKTERITIILSHARTHTHTHL
jgi:hypothetical protein